MVGLPGTLRTDTKVQFGEAGDTPVVGDWNGNGRTDIGVFRPTTAAWYLDNNGTTYWQGGDTFSTFGNPGVTETPIVGDWTGAAGKDLIGIYTNETWYLQSLSSNLGYSTYYINIGNATPLVNDSLVLEALYADQNSSVVGFTAGTPLSPSELNSVVDQAISIWSSAGLSNNQLSRLRQVDYSVRNLPDHLLGEAWSNGIAIDGNGEGRGWIINSQTNGTLSTQGGSSGGFDLLTVVLHEMGHILGLSDQNTDPGDLMYYELSAGIQKLPTSADVDEIFAAN